MDPLFSFDPASMSVWARVPTLRTEHETERVRAMILSALGGDHLTALALCQAEPDDGTRRRSEVILPALWHEVRHFADTLLTSYGASQTRAFQSAALNVPVLVKEALASGGRLALPVTAHLDPVRRAALGLPAPTSDLETIARDVKGRRWLTDRDARLLSSGDTRLTVGGGSQLEALAWFSQASITQQEFGPAAAEELQRTPGASQWRWQYTWAVALGVGAGLSVEGDDGSGVAAHVPQLSALLYGALMVRRWGQDQTPDGSSGFAAERLVPLLEETVSAGLLRQATDDGEAWDAVDAAASRAFGRTATEELVIDLSYHERFVQRIVNERSDQDPVARFAVDHLQARLALARRFLEDPGIVLNPFRYADLLGAVHPHPVLVELGGGSLPVGLPGWHALEVYGDEDRFPGRWWWLASTRPQFASDGAGVVMLRDADAWEQMVTTLAPVAKLLERGRHHRVTIGHELDHAEATLRRLGLDVRVDPGFRRPVFDESTEQYWYFRPGEPAVCDLCSGTVAPGHGFSVDAWTLRHDTRYASMMPTGYFDWQPTDWQGFLVCDPCHRKALDHPSRVVA